MLRALHLPRGSKLAFAVVVLPSTSRLSTFTQSPVPEMFTKAVKAHIEHPKSLRPMPSRLNATIATATPSEERLGPPTEPLDFKPTTGRNSLSNLHGSVQFSNASDLCFRGGDEAFVGGGMPQSSAPLPWSSSPPLDDMSLPNPRPVKKRTIPWDSVPREEGVVKKVASCKSFQYTQNNSFEASKIHQFSKPTTATITNPETRPQQQAHTTVQTPVRKKEKYLWDKSYSALKDEHKERKKQLRNQLEDKPFNVGGRLKSSVPPMFFSKEQNQVIDAIVKDKASVFYTGSAGTGKSILLREIIRQLRLKYKGDSEAIAVTASTGLAACNVEGTTLHRFAGIGLGKGSAQELVKKIKRNPKTKTRWLRAKVLIVDEISMVDGELFDKLEEISRLIRGNGRPFGGIQVVATGDFFQLPPVPDQGKPVKFAFEAATWNTSIHYTILLTHVFRQKDPVFAGMLNDMRLGRLSPSSIESFRALSRPLEIEDEIDATELFPTRTEVDNANWARMNRLSGDMVTFNAIDSGAITDVKTRETLLNNCMAPMVLQLKKGAQVMLIKNIDETLVNGSLGRVLAFMDEIQFAKHEGISLNDDDLANGKKKKAAVSGIGMGINTAKQWPMVSFTLADGSERHVLCTMESWKIELPNGEIQAQRQQVPLILAWALSIHKAQGQTLQRVKVDLGKVFEKGQAYVALSRATSQSGLQVSRFDPRKVMVHPKVKDFYLQLSDANLIDKDRDTGRQNETRTKEVKKPQAKESYMDGLSDSDDDLDPDVLAHYI